ncbi:hypothetical protein AAJ76_6400012338 [Vairimorpha ceranae]|uniref:Uncharacterized protein n=1 Tax=Vairimorpha ceranae TaxID=40302 RepID=A0A0F9WA79_9MICR|nr:hypothetical protein AAJ76_6400012338 [Vairimorpha ceranae]KKO74511.1 hypothetical protein AAJ76_6400012338 [Vairimorpha ceranae]
MRSGIFWCLVLFVSSYFLPIFHGVTFCFIFIVMLLFVNKQY